MTIPNDRKSLLAAIETSFAKLMDVIEAIPPDRIEEATMEGHSTGARMSVRDAVAYLVGWNELVLKWQRRRQAGQAVDFPETGFRWNELGRLAEKFFRDYEALPYPALLERLHRSKSDIVASCREAVGQRLVWRALVRQVAAWADDPVQHGIALCEYAGEAPEMAKSERPHRPWPRSSRPPRVSVSRSSSSAICCCSRVSMRSRIDFTSPERIWSSFSCRPAISISAFKLTS